MEDAAVPFFCPDDIDPRLTRLRADWEALKRGGNTIPFWDDVKPSSLTDLAGTLLLVDVFAKPERFRFNLIGQDLARGTSLVPGQFVDEVELAAPFEYFTSQCSATVESRAPSYFRRTTSSVGAEAGARPYARILLPLWGEGCISMLLGAVSWQ